MSHKIRTINRKPQEENVVIVFIIDPFDDFALLVAK